MKSANAVITATEVMDEVEWYFLDQMDAMDMQACEECMAEADDDTPNFELEEAICYAERYGMSFDARKLYAVTVYDRVDYGISGGVVGIYESLEQANLIADVIRNTGLFKDAMYEQEVTVDEFTMNDRPKYQTGWCYIE